MFLEKFAAAVFWLGVTAISITVLIFISVMLWHFPVATTLFMMAMLFIWSAEYRSYRKRVKRYRGFR